MSNGWIKLYRQLQDCPIWYGERFSKGQAWVDLLLLASHSDKRILFNGEIITVVRGQYLTSIVKLAEKWNWSRPTVTKFLNLLENDKMITRASDNTKTLITIEKYENYQGFEDENSDECLQPPLQPHLQPSLQPSLQQRCTPLYTNNNNKNINNIKESNTKVLLKKSETPKKDINQFFEDVWKLYPKKRGKGQVSDSKKKLLFEIGFEELSRAIERYKSECKEIQYMQNGSTFFTTGYVDYLDKNYSQLPSDKKSKQTFDQRSYDYDNLEKQLLANRQKGRSV